MKKISYIIYLGLIISMIGCSKPENTIKVGQVWKETLHADDPYSKTVIYYKEVIEITGEYVLFIENKKDTLHKKKFWFVVLSECVINCD